MLNDIRRHDVIFVGNRNNDPEIIKSLFNTNKIITTKLSNAFDDIDSYEHQILDHIIQSKDSYSVILFSCGATAKTLIKRIHINPELNAFSIDFGSVIDVFHGRTDWTWVKKAKIDQQYLIDIYNELIVK